MRRLYFLALIAGLAVAALPAQSSQFGVRGIGLPGRGVSTRALGLGGAIGLLDPESVQNPASLAGLLQATSIFTSSNSWGSSTNPSGSANIREARFPHVLIGGPVPKTPLTVAFSYSNYADRDFTVATTGVDSPRGVPIGVIDTLSSRGGINDLRIGAAWAVSKKLAIGAGLHFLTGSNRLSARRIWTDTLYEVPQENTELNYTGLGFSVGATAHPSHRLELAGMVRTDGDLKMRRDSSTTVAHVIGLPITLGAGARFLVRTGMSLSAEVTSRNWSTADAGLKASGGVGADNTLEVAGGMELVRNAKHPTTWPLRLGVRQAQLPFLLLPGDQPKETGFSIGTGRRFSAERGGFDLSLERVTRSASAGYHESAWIFSFGITVHAGGFTP
jgi:hypothetical protein